MRFDTGIFSLAYAGSVRYYAAMLACRKVIVHTSERRKKTPWCAHHCNLIGANGEQTLTLPLVKPAFGPVNTLEISEHGDWRRTHWGALFSAYGKSPFFEYISDDLEAIYNDHNITRLVDFDKAVHNLVVDFLDLPIEVEFTEELPDFGNGVIDLRGEVGMSTLDSIDWISNESYWQVWRDRHGFRADLSIFDLLMTQGREALFVLNKMLK